MPTTKELASQLAQLDAAVSALNARLTKVERLHGDELAALEMRALIAQDRVAANERQRNERQVALERAVETRPDFVAVTTSGSAFTSPPVVEATDRWDSRVVLPALDIAARGRLVLTADEWADRLERDAFVAAAVEKKKLLVESLSKQAADEHASRLFVQRGHRDGLASPSQTMPGVTKA